MFQITHHPGPTLGPEEVERGIVFVLARWSPDAVERFDELHAELGRAKYSGRVIVVDHGALDVVDFGRRFGMGIHGWGEAFVVDRGVVVARSSAEEGSSLADLVRALTW